MPINTVQPGLSAVACGNVMNCLPTFITGFWHVKDGSGLWPKVDSKEFKSAVYDSARRVNGRVEYVDITPQPAKNYHQATVALNGANGRVRLVCNAQYPVIAFSKPRTGFGDIVLEFVDCPAIADALPAVFRVLSKAEASAPLSSVSLEQLGRAELSGIKYWKPRTVGEVIFNNWD
jgi:hypothetical protein